MSAALEATDAARRLMAEGLVAVLGAATRSGLLDALERPRSARQLGQQLGLDPRAVELVLDVLRALGYVERSGDAFHRDVAYPPWPDVDAFLATGEVTPFIDERPLRGEEYSKHVLRLAQLCAGSARQLAEALPEARHIADVGAGSAVWSLAMAARWPETTVTALDLPEVIDAAHLLAERSELGERVRCVGGDWLAPEPRGPFDRVVLANVLHLEDEAGALRLLGCWAERVAEHGELVVIDFFDGDAGPRALSLALYAINLGSRTRRGAPHPRATLARWCSEVGFSRQRVVRLDRDGVALAALVCQRDGAATRPSREGDAHGDASETVTLPRSELEALRSTVATLRRRQRLVFDGARDAIFVIDHRSDRLAAVNAAFRRMFGVDWPLQQSRPYDTLFAPDDLPRFRALLADIRGGRVIESRRYRFSMVRPGDGTRVDAELTGFDPSYASSASFIVRDRAEIARQERLEAIGALAAAVAHDVNTPLGVLRSDAHVVARIGERLRAPRGREPQRLLDQLEQTSQRMVSATERIEAMVKGISSFAKLEGASLKEAAPVFTDNVAATVCQRLTAET